MSNDIDTRATALYVTTDDLLKLRPDLAPQHPAVGFAPRLTDAELVTLAVMQALLGFTSEARWLRYARAHLGPLFMYLPQQPGYNKRLRHAAATIIVVIRALAAGTSLWTDDAWVADSTPVECGRSRETVKRSDLAGWAEYGSRCVLTVASLMCSSRPISAFVLPLATWASTSSSRAESVTDAG